MAYGNDIRLGLTLLLNAIVLGATIYAARRWASDSVQRAVDAMLLWYGVQYAAVCLPGVLGILSFAMMSVTALALSGGLVLLARRSRAEAGSGLRPRADLLACVAAGVFVATFLAALAREFSVLPVLDTDAMTYHVPAAIHWMQTGRISLFPVWFFNPANTFSPLAGSTFINWLYATMGCDVLARFAQAPALLLLCLAVVQLCRGLGMTAIGASLIGVAAALARPFISEVNLAKDDIFLAAFFVVAVAGFGERFRNDRFGPWRIGIALGLAIATKYTVLFSLPILLLLIQPSRLRGRGKRVAIIAVLIALIAGPWFLRNVLLTGNPLYPVNVRVLGKMLFSGILTPARSEKLQTVRDIAQVLAGRYHSLPPYLLCAVLLGWAAAATRAKELLFDPLLRTCVLGPVIGVLIFLIKSPYPEVRFLFPSMALMFAAAGAGANRLLPTRGEWIYAGLLAFLSVATCFSVQQGTVAILALVALLVTAGTLGLLWCDERLGNRRMTARIYAGIAATLLLAGWIYVYWDVYVFNRVSGYQVLHRQAWRQYPEYSDAWIYVQDNIPSDATIAYTNTHVISPLYGFHPSRRVIYCPVRADVPDFLHLPPFPNALAGEQIDSTFRAMLAASPDRERWLARLREAKADYLFIVSKEPVGDPPELAFARADPAHFSEVFQGGAVTIFKISR